MLEKLEDEAFDDQLVFSNEAAFHVIGKVNKHNIHIQDTENPHVILEYAQNFPKIYMLCANIREMCLWSIFLKKPQSMMKDILLTCWKTVDKLIALKKFKDFVFKKNETPPHWNLRVKHYLFSTLTDR